LAAFDDYARTQRPALVRVATVLCGDGGTAEDIVQRVLTKVYQHWDRVQAADVPAAYVRRMLVNEYLSWRRKWSRVSPVADLEDLVPHEPDHGEVHANQVALLDQVLRLPRRQRTAIVLRYYEDHSTHAPAVNQPTTASTSSPTPERSAPGTRDQSTPAAIPTGLSAAQPLFPDSQYTVGQRAWTGRFGETYHRVWAGALGTDTRRSVVVVFRWTPGPQGQMTNAKLTAYPAPSEHGKLTITAVSGTRIQLRAPDGTRFTFDASSNTYAGD
jgi:RNA polymerase sigma factor (sigma-70 family)